MTRTDPGSLRLPPATRSQTRELTDDVSAVGITVAAGIGDQLFSQFFIVPPKLLP
jgi:hypothetical protein